MNKTQPVHIAIADRNMLIREALAALISGWDDCKVVIKATDADDLRKQLSKTHDPVICIIGVGIDGMDTFLRELKYQVKFTEIKVLALGQYHSDYLQTRLIKCGASGYLLNNCQPKELKKALLTIAKKGVYFPNVSKEAYTDIVTNKTPFENLTTRQIELLQYVADGLSYGEIGKKMGIAIRSAESKKDVIANKLNIRSKEGLIVFSLKAGLVEL